MTLDQAGLREFRLKIKSLAKGEGSVDDIITLLETLARNLGLPNASLRLRTGIQLAMEGAGIGRSQVRLLDGRIGFVSHFDHGEAIVNIGRGRPRKIAVIDLKRSGESYVEMPAHSGRKRHRKPIYEPPAHKPAEWE